VFVCGTRVTPGLVGEHPSLTDLADGDLKFHTDFRQVYAALLEHWFGQASHSILGGSFEPVRIVSA
jgi:uncharacterized protein (DUF1501 family)